MPAPRLFGGAGNADARAGDGIVRRWRAIVEQANAEVPLHEVRAVEGAVDAECLRQPRRAAADVAVARGPSAARGTAAVFRYLAGLRKR